MSPSIVFSDNGEEDASVGEASIVVSGIDEEEVCLDETSVLANGNDEDACNGKDSIAVSGKSNYAIKRTFTAEYPCVRRLRERRLLSFLFGQGFHGAFEAYAYVSSLE